MQVGMQVGDTIPGTGIIGIRGIMHPTTMQDIITVREDITNPLRGCALSLRPEDPALRQSLPVRASHLSAALQTA